MISLTLCNILILTWLSSSAAQAPQCGYKSTGLEGSITGPIQSGSYNAAPIRCEWSITVPSTYRIALEFGSMNIEGKTEGQCTTDYVLIESLTESQGTKLHDVYCGVIDDKRTITSVENQFRIKYYYKGYTQYSWKYSYFSFKYKAVPLNPLETARFLIENKELRNENLPKAVSSLFLVDGTYFTSGNPMGENITNRFRLQLGEDLVRNFSRPMAAGDLAVRISGLLAVCINPRSFYGLDLVYHLRKLVDDVTGIPNPYIYLTLCNSGDKMTHHDINKLTAIIEKQNHEMFWLDYQAMAVLALVCIRDRYQGYDVQDTLQNATEEIKSYQLRDGGFGSLQTTSLVVQALTAAETNETDWNRKAAISFINKAKQEDGSYSNIHNLYDIVPVISGKTLLYLNASRCDFKDDLNEISSNNSDSIQLVYSVWVGDHVDVSSSVTLKAPKGTKFFDFMRLAADRDANFRFKWINTKNGPYVYEIGGITNDPSSGRYWTLYTGTHHVNVKFYGKGLEHYIPHDGEMAVMWYRTLTVEH